MVIDPWPKNAISKQYQNKKYAQIAYNIANEIYKLYAILNTIKEILVNNYGWILQKLSTYISS